MHHLEQIAAVCGYLVGIASAVLLLVKPLRDRVFGLRDISGGVQCLLRSDMLRMYYTYQENGTIRQYERQNLETEYRAYKALGGNSFMDDLYKDITDWKVVA